MHTALCSRTPLLVTGLLLGTGLVASTISLPSPPW